MGMKARPPARAGTPRALHDACRAFAFGLPGTVEHHPWGESVAKVRKKVFVFFGRSKELESHFGFSVKLPISGHGVLERPFATPTGYGLGKSGWVSIRSTVERPIPAELALTWIEESYRSIAPKKLIKQLDET
jgi:predicted DNA-binding protein (MmcQ/YjbR family)